MAWRLIGRALFVFAVSLLFGLVGLARWLLLWFRRAGADNRRHQMGVYLAAYCRLLGATYVKAGQILSTRPDLASEALRRPLQQLHDRVGPFGFAAVRETIQDEFQALPEELFSELDPYPVASASVAQVHRGRLANGRAVAVKVLRPGIETVVSYDLKLMRLFARLVAWVPPLRPVGLVQVVETFADAIWRQLDLRIEADNNRRFTESFEAVEDVSFPELLPELCGRRVMTMSFVTGDKVLDRQWEQSEAIVRAGFRMVLKMVFEDGLVHADLHPGNMFVVDQRRLVVVDLGLVAELSDRHKEGLTQLLIGWGARDVPRVCAAMSQVGFYGQPPADPDRLAEDVEALLDRYRDRAMAEIEVGRLLHDLIRMMRKQWAQLDPAMTMVALAVGVVEGLGKELAPELRLVEEALPFVQRAS